MLHAGVTAAGASLPATVVAATGPRLHQDRFLAMFTVRLRPSMLRPSRAVMADWADSESAISTKPKPRDRPVSRSTMTCALETWPCSVKSFSRSEDVVSNVRFPT